MCFLILAVYTTQPCSSDSHGMSAFTDPNFRYFIAQNYQLRVAQILYVNIIFYVFRLRFRPFYIKHTGDAAFSEHVYWAM